MANINMPKRQQSNSGSTLGLIGMGVGAAYGGPAGAGIGSQIGGAVGGQMDKNAAQGPQAVGVLERRKMELDNAPLKQIRDSIDSLQYIQDDAQRADLAQTLMAAEQAARKKV